MSVITTDYHEVLTGILSTLGVAAPWTHNEFIGAVVMNQSRATWLRGENGAVVYHITSENELLSDTLLCVDETGVVTLVAPPRKILGYSAPEEYIASSPICDGSTLKAYFFDGQWRLASRNSVNVYDAAVYSETFGEAFERLAPELDVRMVHIINLTTAENCPSSGTVDMATIIETIRVDEDKIIVTLPTHTTPTTPRYGVMYRTASGIYLDRSDEFVTLNRVIYDVPRSILNRLGNNSRKAYVITRAILMGWDDDFGVKYPSLSVEHTSIRDFVTSLVRHVFTMCCSRTRNPDTLGSFVYHVANKIGPLKSRSGRNVVVDTMYSKEYVESVTHEYLKALGNARC